LDFQRGLAPPLEIHERPPAPAPAVLCRGACWEMAGGSRSGCSTRRPSGSWMATRFKTSSV